MLSCLRLTLASPLAPARPRASRVSPGARSRRELFRASFWSVERGPSLSRLCLQASPPLASASGAGWPSSPAASSTSKYGTRLEHMDTMSLHPYHDLDLAESELNSYCSRLSPDDAPEKCWQAYTFLEQKHEKAKAGCDLDNAKDCEELAHLNDMTHQLLATGSMDDLVATFSTLARVEELRAMRATKQAEHAQQAAEGAGAGEPEKPDPIHALFLRMDADRDGRISIVEFRQGMAMLGDRLDGNTVSLIMDAMDVNDGFLSEQQFRDIWEAESIVSHNQVVEMWRHHAHEGPGWWTSSPRAKGSLRY